MNEIDFLRQQLALERTHLREILQAVRQGNPALGDARPVADYIDWASPRLLRQLDAHRTALQAAPATGAETRRQLDKLSGAAAAVSDAAHGRPADLSAERLLALLDAWSEPLETQAGRTLRTSHWRRAAHLSADTVLEERHLYGAARLAAALP